MLVYIFILIVLACLVILIYSRVKKEGFKVNLVFLDNKTGKIIASPKRSLVRKWDRNEYIDNRRRRVPIGLQDPNN